MILEEQGRILRCESLSRSQSLPLLVRKTVYKPGGRSKKDFGAGFCERVIPVNISLGDWKG